MLPTAPQGYYAQDTAPVAVRPALQGAVEAEVCIIGGGFTGLSAALHLAQCGMTPLLIEAEQIGFGASGRNGGQLHPGQRLDQPTLERWLGVGHARDLWGLAEAGLILARDLAAKAQVPVCDGLIIAAHDRPALAALEAEADHMARHYHCPAKLLDADEIAAATGSAMYCGGRVEPGGGHLQPLHLARGLADLAAAAGARLHERTRAMRLEHCRDGMRVQCVGAEISARRVLVACDAWTGSLLPQLEPQIAPVESYLVATAPLPPDLGARVLAANPAVADTRHVLDYYRKSHDGRLIFSGGETYFGPPRDIAALVRPRLLAVFPQLADVGIDYAWSGTVGITRTRMPQFGRMGERLLYGFGYSGHGLALSLLGGQLLAEAALGRSDGFEAFARVPAKPFPGGPMLRRPLVAAALLLLKTLDAL